MSELGFNFPPTTRSNGDGTSVLSLIRKTGEAGDRSCDPWIGSQACYPLHHRGSFLSGILDLYSQFHIYVVENVTRTIKNLIHYKL